MTITIDVTPKDWATANNWFHFLIGQASTFNAKIDQVIAFNNTFQGELKTMSDVISQNLQDLEAEIAAETTVEQSAITLLNGIPALITAAVAKAANGDTAALPALAAQIKASREKLAAAILAGTGAPGAPAPLSPPAPPTAPPVI